MQAEREALDNTSWTYDESHETTIVSNQLSMLAVWDMAAWSESVAIIAITALIVNHNLPGKLE